MKRKLVCVFFMLAGMATIAGTIMLSLGRPGNADVSPVYMLIIVSIVTIIAAAFHINEPGAPKVFGRERVSLRVFHVIGILAILVSFAFIVIMLFITRQYTDWMQNIFILMVLAAAGMAAAALCLKVRPPIIVRNVAKAVVTLVIAAALCFVYINYIPKYSQDDGKYLLRSKGEFAQTDIYYPEIYGLGEMTGAYPRSDDSSELFGGNPFYEGLFQYFSELYGFDADGLYYVKGVINFNPATGAYLLTEIKDKTYFSGEWPKLKWNFMYDKDGRHDVILNLYFREWWPDPEAAAAGINQRLFISSSEWDAKIKDVIYPHSLPEDEARAFLGSIGEETLKTKLLKQVNSLDSYILSKIEGKTVEVYFFGIEIATYKNGEIDLKI